MAKQNEGQRQAEARNRRSVPPKQNASKPIDKSVRQTKSARLFRVLCAGLFAALPSSFTFVSDPGPFDATGQNADNARIGHEATTR